MPQSSQGINPYESPEIESNQTQPEERVPEYLKNMVERLNTVEDIDRALPGLEADLALTRETLGRIKKHEGDPKKEIHDWAEQITNMEVTIRAFETITEQTFRELQGLVTLLRQKKIELEAGKTVKGG